MFPNVFEDVLDPLERPTSSFDTVWGVLKTLYLGDIKIVPARIYSNLEKRINIARATRYNTDAIFKACKVGVFICNKYFIKIFNVRKVISDVSL